MSIVFVFVAVWVVVLLVWVALDWLGNPNRGHFRPQREYYSRGGLTRRQRRILRRARGDAAVRAVLRDRFGRSSLRLHWGADREAQAVRADEDLSTMWRSAAGLRHLAEDEAVELLEARLDAAYGESNAPDLTDADEVLEHGGAGDRTDEEEVEEKRLPPPQPTRGWRLGDDPLAPTRRGTPPAPATVRSRVWKNQSEDPGWDDYNRERLRAGKPPRRRNPLTGKPELAVVDVERGTAAWPELAVDPYGEDE